jgi:N-acetylgalactosamine-N,N'-diacetylbacillosaminyl-diphospho-undecaprenol 4-alpha-N-acetylgalactosaminyltransferase
MKNVALLINSMESGGAERVVSLLANEMHDNENNIHVVTLQKGNVYNLSNGINQVTLGRITVNNGILKVAFLLYYAYKLRIFCAQNDIHVVKSHMYRPNYINVLSKFLGNKSKCILVQHSHASNSYSSRGVVGYFSKTLISIFYRKADGVVTVSKLMREDLIRNFSIEPHKVKYIGNPINRDLITAMSKMPIETPYSFSKYTFVTTGSFIERKNHKLIIEAVKSIGRSDYHLLIMGQGPLKQKYIDMIQLYNLDHMITILDFNNNPFFIMRQSNCFINSSNAEGLPMVMLEALACGIPVISTDCLSGPREIVAPNTNYQEMLTTDIEETPYGILTPVNSIDHLAKAMEVMISSNSFRRRQKIFSDRVKEYLLPNIVHEYQKLL